MESRVALRDEWKPRIESIQTQLGPHHPAVLKAKEEIKAVEKAIATRAQELGERFLIRWTENGTGGKLVPTNLDNLRRRVQRLMMERNAMVELLAAIDPGVHDIETQNDKVESAGTKTPTGTDDPILTARRLELLKLESTLRDAEENLAAAEYEVQHAKSLTFDDFARVDETIRDLIRRREDAQRKYEELVSTRGDGSPEVKAAEKESARTAQAVTARVAEMADRFIVRWREDGTPTLFPHDLGALRAKVDRLKVRLQEEQKRVEEMGRR